MRAFGSLTNRVMEDIRPPVPVVGMGATRLMFSDRHAYTVVEVAANGKVCWVTQDTALQGPDWDYYKQNYSGYQSNMDSPHRTKLKLGKDGRWRSTYHIPKQRKDGTEYWAELSSTEVFRMGSREEYQDPHF